MKRHKQTQQATSVAPWTCEACGEYWHWLHEAGEPVCAACATRQEIPSHPWLDRFPEYERREVKAIVAHQAVQEGVQTPADVLQRVARFLNDILVFSGSPHTRQRGLAMLAALARTERRRWRVRQRCYHASKEGAHLCPSLLQSSRLTWPMAPCGVALYPCPAGGVGGPLRQRPRPRR
jgi:hypothetical protein